MYHNNKVSSLSIPFLTIFLQHPVQLSTSLNSTFNTTSTSIVFLRAIVYTKKNFCKIFQVTKTTIDGKENNDGRNYYDRNDDNNKSCCKKKNEKDVLKSFESEKEEG